MNLMALQRVRLRLARPAPRQPSPTDERDTRTSLLFHWGVDIRRHGG
jgi:hypothetical protein